ncbi:hypothetical protein R0K04_28540, partial [Pseudoalteromonas sp. SIMBA_153]
RWVIVNMPDARKYNDMRDLLQEKTPVIVRFVLENESGEICAFRIDRFLHNGIVLPLLKSYFRLIKFGRNDN